MSNKAPKSPRSKKQRRKADRGKTRLTLGTVLGGTATVIGVIAAVATFWPHVTVATTDPVDPNDPFSSTVTVTNAGMIPLDNVGYDVAVRGLYSSYENSLGGDASYGDVFVPDSGKGRYMVPDSHYSFPFNKIIDGDREDVISADFAILIHYEVPILHWHRQTLTPIKVTRLEDGNFHWYAEPEPAHYTIATKGYRIASTIHMPRRPK